ncbi:MAG: hypothetical protein OJF51_002881 [Nitrospira sp.]|jgi:hypothetical protein|nr:MAG: hypothetical protein OJF51_002881 [Nitrospira sp.]
MSIPINNLSSGSFYQADGVNTYQQRRQSFEALAQALQSNDLTAAKQAYTALAQSIPSGADSRAIPLHKLVKRCNRMISPRPGTPSPHYRHGTNIIITMGIRSQTLHRLAPPKRVQPQIQATKSTSQRSKLFGQ